ncbi:MAG: Ig-like domain-containing protein, partial [Minicystis sp.]
MKNLRHVLLLLILTVFGCGEQLVEFPLDSAPTVIFTNPANGDIGVATNTKVSAAFSEAMDPATLDASTFTLTRAGAAVAATVTYTGTAAILAPKAALETNALFVATITTGAKNSAGNALAANYVWSFTTRDAPDTTPPTVIFTDPADKAVAVANDIEIRAAFSEVMDSATINGATFTVTQGAAKIPGTVAYSGLTATFTPKDSLAMNATFTATITADAKDLTGNALSSDYVWTFTTNIIPVVTPPKVIFTYPLDGAVDVDITASVVATFDEPMDCATLNVATFTVMQGAILVPGAVTCKGPIATFEPAISLAVNAVFTATITTGAKDPSGNALAADYVWDFTTGDVPVVAPHVTFTDPANGDMGVNVNTSVKAAFDVKMSCATLNAATFTLKQGVVPVLGVVSCNGANTTFTPAGPLANDAAFTATITTGAKDLNGNALAADYVW